MKRHVLFVKKLREVYVNNQQPFGRLDDSIFIEFMKMSIDIKDTELYNHIKWIEKFDIDVIKDFNIKKFEFYYIDMDSHSFTGIFEQCFWTNWNPMDKTYTLNESIECPTSLLCYIYYTLMKVYRVWYNVLQDYINNPFNLEDVPLEWNSSIRHAHQIIYRS